MVLKLGEIEDMTLAEIDEQLVKSRLELINLRMKFKSRQLDDVSQVKKQRKEIARLLTVQTQKTVKVGKKDELETVKKDKLKIAKTNKDKEPDQIKKITLKSKTRKKKEK